MAARRILLCLLLCMIDTTVCLQRLDRHYVSPQGRPIIALCPPHDGTYTKRRWLWNDEFWRPTSLIYTQNNGGALNTVGARADMSLDPVDFSLTIGSPQVTDTGTVYCLVETGGPRLSEYTHLVVYNRWRDVEYLTSITLQCPLAMQGYTTRRWHFPLAVHFIYSQNTSGVTQGIYKRLNQWSLDADNFNLTIPRTYHYDIEYDCSVTIQQTTKFAIIFIAIYRFEFEAEEGTSVTMPCELSAPNHFYTRTWQRVNGDVLYHQGLYDGALYERPSAARADMSLNNETFALSINRVQLEDDTSFICSFGTRSRVKSVKLIIFINPKIILSGLDDTPVSVGTTVTVSCTIGRVYPELRPGDFQMRWGTQTLMSTGSQNSDRSYRYSVQYTHTLNNDDAGTMVECLVNPEKGQSDSTSKTIIINDQKDKNTSPSPTTIDAVSPLVTDGDVLPDTSVVSLPVIGGSVAAAAVLIVIIVLSVCVYVRGRKARVSNQTTRTGESHRTHGLNAPDVISSDDIYLPGADYHEYEEVAPPGHTPRPSTSEQRRYERLQTRLNANTPLNVWFKEKALSQSIVKKLKKHKIITIQDLRDMSRGDMVEAGLKVGERNQIKRVLRDHATSRF